MRAQPSRRSRRASRCEHHTSGYKQLQIHVHKSLREVDETLVVAPDEFRPPLEVVAAILANMDDELLELLFPRHPSRRTRTEEFWRARSVAMKYAASLALCISLIATGFLAIPSRAAQKDYLSSWSLTKSRCGRHE